ncbi:ABC transporter substrate-binding protein [Candidatus Phytoplasma meliae]|uniref:Solute-binding protein family 5 domain-containing protein n=1 Tax=Candidatus Phytoplasma meliae TaxID=1848402 RepID=A0ABS5CYN6_9MOLU|nr:ABC transporter substrate-binding protein [Candidatus Phytoplasma meliae]MBP5836082.1 hypothetical protein [Candidatus Phytoplasma meliae]
MYTKIEFNPENTYKKAVNSLPYHLHPILNLNSSGKINNEKKIQKEIMDLLKIPFVKVEPDFKHIPEQKFTSNCFPQKISSSICQSLKYQNSGNREEEVNFEQNVDFLAKAQNIFINRITFTINKNLTFENNEPINKDTIKNSIKAYLNKDKNKMSSENKSYFWILKLKKALNYYNNPKFLQNDKLIFFEEDAKDPFSFSLIFEKEYVCDNSLMDMIKWMNELIWFPNEILQKKSNFDTYGTPQNPFISYGYYIIDQYIPEKGLLLHKRKSFGDHLKIQNIFYKVYQDEQEKINDFQNKLLNELELLKAPGVNEYQNVYLIPENKITILAFNQGQRHDANLMMDKDFKKEISSIVSDYRFKNVLQQIMKQKNIIINNSRFSSINNKSNFLNQTEVVNSPSPIIIDIKKTLQESYLSWKDLNPLTDLIILDLVICGNDLQKKEIANTIKQELENALNLDDFKKIEINIKNAAFNERAGVFLEEFQKSYDLLITDVFYEKNPQTLIPFYLSLLEKTNLSDKLIFNFSATEERKQVLAQNLQMPQINDLNAEQIQQCFENYQKQKHKITNSQHLHILSDFYKTLEEFIKNEFIDKYQSIYILSENYKYMAYQHLSSDYFDYYEPLDFIKLQYFVLTTESNSL